jgi:hypothetical protein
MSDEPDDSWVELTRLIDPFEVSMLASMLRVYGIPVITPDFNASFAVEGATFFLGGGRLLVPAPLEAQARALMAAPVEPVANGPWDNANQ